ncbi:hypothetical protein B0H17DRAFT_1176044 [Mycena rosella]|uniref:Uncharacterized protein n=1 Tax=Mycena rosella TaxID=1033263 RepID=A0AAD7DZK5_MYCRO|nr:hypothetical protein B0H17DRAFT_1176044 [Mycena rosella]
MSVAGCVGGFRIPGSPAREALERKKKKAAPASTTLPVPGSTDALTGFVNVAAPPRSGRGSRGRNLTAQIAAAFPSATAMAAATDAFDRVHLRPISIATERNHTLAKRLWLDWFTQLYRSADKAAATLKEGRRLPPARRGKAVLPLSGDQGALGARDIGRHRLVAAHDAHLRGPHAVSHWAYKDHAITTLRKVKRMVRESDLVELLAVCLKSTLNIASKFSRIQMMGLVALIYTHGPRPGTLVDANGFEGLGEHVKWKNTEWMVYGYDKGAGLGIQSFWVFEWAKGQRFDKSLDISTSMRNLGRSRIHIDAQLIIEALDPATFTFPFKLTIRESALELPIFRNADKTDALTLNSATHFLAKIRKALNWTNFTWYSLRYSFASSMVDRVSEVHLRYLMGHTSASKLAVSAYQVPDRPVDVSGARFAEENTDFAAMSQAHSSVAWNRPPPPSDDTVKTDPKMKQFIAELAEKEAAVRSKFGADKTAQALFEEGNEHGLVLEAREVQTEMLRYYLTLSSGFADLAPSTAVLTPAPPDTPDPATSSLIESMMDLWAATDNTHPFLALIASEPDNPRLAVVQRYPALLHLDDEKTGSRCLWCFTDPKLTPAQQNKDHKDHYVQHVGSCELDHHPNHWRCPVCIQLIPAVPKRSNTFKHPRGEPKLPVVALPSILVDDEMEEEERAAIHDAMAAHAAGCFERLMAIVRGDEGEGAGESDSEDGRLAADSDVAMNSAHGSDVSMDSVRSHKTLIRSQQKRATTGPDRGDGARLLSIQMPFDAGRSQSRALRLHSFFFCPICLFAEGDAWHDRLRSFPNIPKLMAHIATHWRSIVTRNAMEIDYKLKFKCGVPPCTSDVVRKTGDMIDHLHKAHQYNLIQCNTHCGNPTSTCDPERCAEKHHDDTCFTLPTKFCFFTDALLLADDHIPTKKRQALPPACLVDYRKTDVQGRWWKALCKTLGIPVFTFTVPGKRRVTKPTTPASTSTPAAAPDPVHFTLRRCLAAIVSLHPEFGAVNVEKLIDAGITAEQLSRFPRNLMPECDFAFTLPLYTRFIAAVKQWIVNSELEDAVEMLVSEFPGVVTPDLAVALQRDNLKIYDILDCSAADIAEYGLVVETNVWDLIRRSAEQWLEARATAMAID